MTIEKTRDHCDEDYEDYEVDEEELSGPDDYCGDCGHPAVGDHCQQCGLPLCPICFETGASFCKQHPDEHFSEVWQEVAQLNLEAIEARCEAARCEVNRLCQRKTSWVMSIPVREDDTDVVLTNSFHDIPALVTEVRQLRRELHDERARRYEWEKLNDLLIAGTEVRRLRAELEHMAARETMLVETSRRALRAMRADFRPEHLNELRRIIEEA